MKEDKKWRKGGYVIIVLRGWMKEEDEDRFLQTERKREKRK